MTATTTRETERSSKGLAPGTVGVLGAVVLTTLADRRGRRRVLLTQLDARAKPVRMPVELEPPAELALHQGGEQA